MLIDDENIRVQYDSTAESPIMAGDPLPLPFKFVEKTQVRAILSDGTELIINQDYTVGYPEEEEPDEDESIAMTDNMVVILNIDIPVGETITIYRETTLDQTSEFPQEARFSSRKIEDALDKLTMQNQEQRESLGRALKLPLNAPIDIINLSLPNPEPNRSVKWNGQGTALVNTEFDPDTALVTTESYKNQALTAATGAAKSEAEAIKQATDAKNAAKSVNDNIQSALDKSDSLLNMSRILPMFTPIWSDHTLNDASFLRADTFSWHSGKIFKAGYDTLVAEYNREECVTETEAGVTYKRTPSGFKIASLDQHDNVLNSFTSTGKSWFYVLDTVQQRFKLPRTKYSFTGIRDTVGGGVDAGLPSLSSNSTGAHTHTRGTMNITGSFALGDKSDAYTTYTNNLQFGSGAFYSDSTATYGYNEGGGEATSNIPKFDASRSWTGATSSNGAHSHTITDSAGVLGKSNTVQPPATQMYLYFFVGNYVRPNTDINIGKLVEYINEIDFVGATEDAKAELNTTKNNCIKEINSTSVGGRVLKTGDTMTGNLKIHGGSTQHVFQCISDLLMSENPTTAVGVGKFQVLDKEGNFLMQVGCERSTDGRNNAFIRAHSPSDWSNSASISVSFLRDGTVYTSAPTPATGDNSTKIATTAYCVNMRCTSKATTKSSASTTRPCWVVQNYVSGTSWYRVWSDGWIEQGGAATIGTGATTITFLKSFSNASYTFTCTPISGDGAYTSVTMKSLTAQDIVVYLQQSNYTKSSRWYACGY